MTKKPAKESGALARVRIGMRTEAKAARTEEKTLGRKAVARNEAKDKRKAERERPERVGHAERQDTLQLGAGKEEQRTCMPWTKMTVKRPRNTQTDRLKVKTICRPGEYWKRATASSGRKSSVDEANKEQRKSIKRHC